MGCASERVGRGARVAEKQADGSWHVNQWAKKAVLLGFRIKDMEQQDGGPQGGGWWDKVDSKFKGWGDNQWKAAGFRADPRFAVLMDSIGLLDYWRNVAPGEAVLAGARRLGDFGESEDYTDPLHGIPVFSLYGETRIPTAEMLAPIDLLLVDLQDVGTRVYTFIYTLAHCMEAARQDVKKIIVLNNQFGEGVCHEDPVLMYFE